MWFRSQLLLVLAGVLSCGTGAMEELFEDDPCTLHTGERGVCRRAIACTWLKGAIRSQEITYAQLIRCGFDRDEPIVCCRTDPVKATRVGVQPATRACATYDGKRPQLAYHIVGGSEAESGEVPFIGALGYRLGDQSSEDSAGYKWACGSSLIAPNFLMTAAHCIDTVHGSPVVVRMGTHNLLSPPIPEEVQDRLIKRIIIHPGYKKNLKYDDIALLEVVSPFKFDEVVQPACLTIDRNDLPTSTVLLVAGWGLTTTGDSPEALLKANLTTVPIETCGKTYETFKSRLRDGIRPSQYCARGLQVSDGFWGDSCDGDSGGPMYYLAGDENAPKYYLLGVTSFGPGCGSPNPSVYTRVASYVDWIETQVWPADTT